MMVTARNTFGRSSLAIAHTTQDGERGRGARAGGGGVAERVEYKWIRWAKSACFFLF